METPESDSVRDRLAIVRERVDAALRTAGRSPDDVTTIVVTKFHPASLVRELFHEGVRNVGESRHQEAELKVAELSDLDLTWHFVGQLQSKKARKVREYARVIHAVDRESLVASLGGAGNPVDVFLQVNLTDDPARGGVQPAEVGRLADRIESTPGLTLQGLMAVAPLDAEPRRSFALVRELSERLQREHPNAVNLSMGMSGDFEEAILEGATHLRIGTAITGNRPAIG
ncbi:pyridoxal phosphate enzyme (YggS family) [Microbacteriaceae bacterium SG_E_30_P1]|uniref:Pyridoxal phosphate homeostasis protein n=1 Tax=Antiquaquibacter oligotrophicus TaxID=2880260 RepID=A0ABT6KLC7_9MICO|nr:YggS family pyridoxal phosphate-dependent enzyme [Antiquaquibacter oligotrophicus]MDH6180824.1 pyridoxal phosphate enzyme (YggS family) [Antiquaquibacter oligotrophicus]UDF13460.1 YggS family pyridoxal phosphate-dependent enzyme [Antiquaquibacter oligotrophicus]